eukprot:8781587-Pyramimonas_sp.AAC.1
MSSWDTCTPRGTPLDGGWAISIRLSEVLGGPAFRPICHQARHQWYSYGTYAAALNSTLMLLRL